MLPGIELASCHDLAVPPDVMHHVVQVESSYNPYAIGVVGGRLARQPRTLAEALATARMLERGGYDFSLGLAQVNRRNLRRYGLASYTQAFEACPNVQAGARILAECHARAGGDWGKAFRCYSGGNFVTGFRPGYVHMVLASMEGWGAAPATEPVGIPVIDRRTAVHPRQPRARGDVLSAALRPLRTDPAPPPASGTAGVAPSRADGAFVY